VKKKDGGRGGKPTERQPADSAGSPSILSGNEKGTQLKDFSQKKTGLLMRRIAGVNKDAL